MAKKLKILCLHGYFQTAAIMKDRTPAIHRKIKSLADMCTMFQVFLAIDYLDGPVTVNCMEGFKPELGTEFVIFFVL